MELEEFKQKCKKQRERYDENLKRWNSLIEIQKQNYLGSCYRPKEKFVWRKLQNIKLCPNCNTELDTEVIKYHSYSEWSSVIYQCFKCGYEYAR